mmetsp:Transcript_46619/g.149770  ORF Transcript_46619/g.149770 Transcript_46619/m.149770 type:complete len:259 (-) Transcript_46619:1402-2178(-)
MKQAPTSGEVSPRPRSTPGRGCPRAARRGSSRAMGGTSGPAARSATTRGQRRARQGRGAARRGSGCARRPERHRPCSQTRARGAQSAWRGSRRALGAPTQRPAAPGPEWTRTLGRAAQRGRPAPAGRATGTWPRCPPPARRPFAGPQHARRASRAPARCSRSAPAPRSPRPSRRVPSSTAGRGWRRAFAFRLDRLSGPTPLELNSHALQASPSQPPGCQVWKLGISMHRIGSGGSSAQAPPASLRRARRANPGTSAGG